MKNFQGLTDLKKSTLGSTNASTIPTVTTIETAAHENKIASTSFFA